MNVNDAHVHRAVAGDADALTELLEAFAPGVERTLQISSTWQSMLEPADVMQVSFLEAYLQIGTCAAEDLQTFEAWLRRLAQNNLQDAIRGLQRKKRPQPRHRVSAEPGDNSIASLYEILGVTTTTPSRYAARDELLRHLLSALDTLPHDYQKAIRLYDLEDLDIAETADRMQRSPGAIHMLRARGLECLREKMGPAIDSLSRLP